MDTAITFPVGVVATPTKTSRSGSWADAHLVRWDGGKMRPVKGWEKYNYTSFASKVRAIHSWTTLIGIRYTAFLCEGHCYVDKGDGILVDISPDPPLSRPSDNLAQGGYGDNAYSFEEYGTPRPNRERDLAIPYGYYIDNWGANLVVMTGADGRLLQYDTAAIGAVLEPVENAPTGNTAFVITKQRHVVLFGAGGVYNRFAWCSQEEITNWSYADVTKTAGFYDLQPASPMVTAHVAGDEFVFWTADGTMYVSQYIGVPFIYNYNAIASGATPVSPMSVASVGNGIIWNSFGGFWKYDQSVLDGIPCDIWSYITDDINTPKARYNAAMVGVTTKSEVWWFYPSTGETENNKCVIFNYKDMWWSKALLNRACGFTSSYINRPIMSDGDNVYEHESGWYYQGADLPWATTYTLNVGGGAALSTIMPSLPDIEGDPASLVFKMAYSFQRNNEKVEYETSELALNSIGRIPFRDTGRDFRLTVKQVVAGDGPWTMGDLILDLVQRGTV